MRRATQLVDGVVLHAMHAMEHVDHRARPASDVWKHSVADRLVVPSERPDLYQALFGEQSDVPA